MDTTETITHVSLCAGYGGIDLGLKRAIPAMRTVAFSEIEAFACANLVAKMEAGLLDPAPVWTNLKTFPWAEFRDRVDILSVGYPCQPFSAAGKRLGIEDPRHLWPFIADGIRLMRPRLCFFENVEGHISLGLRAVLSELEGIGYTATWGIFSASEVGAPHQRKRVFIMANRIEPGLEGYAGYGAGRFRQEWQVSEPDRSASPFGVSLWPSRPGEPQHGWEPPRVVADAGRAQRRAVAASGDEHNGHDAGREQEASWPAQSGEGVEHPTGARCDRPVGRAEGEARDDARVPVLGAGCERSQRQAQPPLGGDADGPASGLDYAKLCVSRDNRTDELRLLGNGVVPAVAHKAFVTLACELFGINNSTKTNT